MTPALRSMSSASSGAGDGWIASPKRSRARSATGAARSMCIKTKTAWVVIHGRLEPETGNVLMKALEAAREALYQRTQVAHPDTGLINRNVPAGTFQDPAAEPRAFGQQPADALALLAETALHHGIDPGTPGERYQVVVHVDAPVLAESDALADPAASGQSLLEAGAHVSAETSRRLACDATREVMRHDAEGQVTEVGGLPFAQAHHVRHWARGGPTTLSNLALLCRRHHRTVHEDGYQVERQPDGALRFRRQNDARGLHIDARTSMPGWFGERLDVGYAIDVLHPLAATAR